MNMPHVYKPDCTEPTLNLARNEFRLDKVEFWYEKLNFGSKKSICDSKKVEF